MCRSYDIIEFNFFQRTEIQEKHTSGGNIFFVAWRDTEKPPWVLVSLVVNVLHNNFVGFLLLFTPIVWANSAS